MNDATYIDGKYLPSIEEVERRNRIRLSVFAYAYEFENDSLISDGDYDRLSYKIKPDRSTGNAKLDKFFRDNFQPDTGMWVRCHPDLNKLRALYFMWKNDFNYKKYWRVGANIIDLDKQECIM
jgi:hypothetical protein